MVFTLQSSDYELWTITKAYRQLNVAKSRKQSSFSSNFKKWSKLLYTNSILKGQFFRLVRQHQNQIYPLDCMRTSRNLKGQPGKLKERQGAPTGYYYYILQLRRVGLRLYRSSFPELSLPEGAGGAEAAARRNSARLKIMGWVLPSFVQKLK